MSEHYIPRGLPVGSGLGPSWTPVRRGDVYCSPACGHNCKTKDWEQARIDAEKMARRLGRRWDFRVHENLGWFAKASFYVDEDNHAEVAGKPHSCTCYLWLGGHQFIASAGDPKDAYQKALAEGLKTAGDIATGASLIAGES